MVRKLYRNVTKFLDPYRMVLFVEHGFYELVKNILMSVDLVLTRNKVNIIEEKETGTVRDEFLSCLLPSWNLNIDHERDLYDPFIRPLLQILFFSGSL